MADARSVLGILILCAGLGTTLEIEASGPDEREAIRAVDTFFASSEESQVAELFSNKLRLSPPRQAQFSKPR